MAEGHLCVKNAAIRDAKVAFGHDKSFKNDTFHFYEKALSLGTKVIHLHKFNSY
jgi:hypothetical protein